MIDNTSRLAVNIMKWEEARTGGLTSPLCWYDAKGDYVMPVREWRPDTNITQALMVAEAFIDKHGGHVDVHIGWHFGELEVVIKFANAVYEHEAMCAATLPSVLCSALTEADDRLVK